MQSKTTFLGYTLWSSRLITIINIYVHTIILSFISLSLQIPHFNSINHSKLITKTFTPSSSIIFTTFYSFLLLLPIDTFFMASLHFYYQVIFILSYLHLFLLLWQISSLTTYSIFTFKPTILETIFNPLKFLWFHPIMPILLS